MIASCYEPPVAAHWDGDVLMLTTTRDPSSIHVQRGEGQTRKVYSGELELIAATLDAGTCHNVHEPPKDTTFWPSPHFKCSECGATHVSMEYVFYCPNCGRKVVEE